MIPKRKATSQELTDEVRKLRAEAALLLSEFGEAESTFSAEARAIAAFLERVLPHEGTAETDDQSGDATPPEHQR